MFSGLVLVMTARDTGLSHFKPAISSAPPLGGRSLFLDDARNGGGESLSDDVRLSIVPCISF